MCTFRIAQPNRQLEQRVKYRLEIKRGAADDLEHVSGGRLLLQRFAQLVEQAGVLDGDHRLRGKSRDQIDLLLRERVNLRSRQEHGPDRNPLTHERNAESRAKAAELL